MKKTLLAMMTLTFYSCSTTSTFLSRQPSAEDIVVYDSDFSYEDYIMDYDRDAFRACLSDRHLMKYHHKPRIDLFLCRLPADFRACVNSHAKKPRKTSPFEDRVVYEQCKSSTNKNLLDDVEVAFYDHVLFGEVINLDEVSPRRAQNSGWYYEEVIKEYDRESYRSAFLNPSYENLNTKEMLLWARLKINFRQCFHKKFDQYSLSDQSKRGEILDKCAGDLNDDGTLSELERDQYKKVFIIEI